VRSGVTYKTVSGELVPGYGCGYVAGGDENGKICKLAGEYTDVHNVLVSASATH
jgi:hypothetical protein